MPILVQQLVYSRSEASTPLAWWHGKKCAKGRILPQRSSLVFALRSPRSVAAAADEGRLAFCPSVHPSVCCSKGS